MELTEVPVDPRETYQMVGVYSFGRGLFAKKPVSGQETSYRRLYRLSTGQLVMSQLFGWEGALAIVPPEFDGLFVSPHFPTFTPRDDRLTSEYLGWLVRSPGLWHQLSRAARGVGDRRRTVTSDDLLRAMVWLPPAALRDRLTESLGRIADATSLARLEAETLSENLRRMRVLLATRPDLSESQKETRGWKVRQLGELVQPRLEVTFVEADKTYPNVGIYSFGRGLFAKADIDGAQTSTSRLFRLKQGDFVYSKLFAFEGAFAVVDHEYHGAYVSSEFPVFELRPDVMPEFVRSYFASDGVWAALAGRTRGLGNRRRRLYPQQLLDHQLWFPPLDYQARLDSMSSALSASLAAASDTPRRLETVVAGLAARLTGS